MNITKKLSTTLLTLLLMGIWVEVLCRIFYSPPSFHSSPSFLNRLKGQRPNWHSEGTYKLGTPEKPRIMTVTTNSYGFRGDDFDIQKTRGTTRILCVGDSITFGWGVNNEDTFPAQLQNLFDGNENNRVEILNAGIGDIGTAEEIQELPLFLNQLDIDIVILGFFMNDSRPPQGFNDEFMYEGALNRFFRTSQIVRSSYFLRFLYEQILKIQIRQHFTPEMNKRFQWAERYKSRAWETDPNEARLLIEEAQYDWGAAWEEESWIGLDYEFKKLEKLSHHYGVKIVLLALPVSVQVYGAANDYPQRQLERVADMHHWLFVNPLLALTKENPKTIFFDQCHLTEIGNRIVAKNLYDLLHEKYGNF